MAVHLFMNSIKTFALCAILLYAPAVPAKAPVVDPAEAPAAAPVEVKCPPAGPRLKRPP